jgi:hypothetical protein
MAKEDGGSQPLQILVSTDLTGDDDRGIAMARNVERVGLESAMHEEGGEKWRQPEA